jgi:hypothetical protein
MADNQKADAPKPGMDQKPKRNEGSDLPVVGEDVPDESKERHTEIAVEAGEKVGQKHDKKA